MENRYEQLKKEILKCIDNTYVMPKNIPTPFGRAVLIKQLEQTEVTTDSGLIIGGIKANNVLRPNIGIIVAVGPDVPEYLIPRLRVYFNQNIDLEYFIGGQFYKMSDYSDIYATIPEGTLTSMDTKSDKEVHREKAMSDEASYNERIKGKDNNDILEILKNPKYKA